jgi:preprotein translocase subunit YajC
VSFLILMVLLLVVFYVMLIRPQRRRQAEHQSTIDALGEGEDVLTTGGIYGTVTQVEGDDLVVEIADGVSVHMTRRGIAAVLPPEDEDEDEALDDEEEGEELDEMDELDDSDVEPDEAAVAAGEEAVMSDHDRGSRSEERR